MFKKFIPYALMSSMMMAGLTPILPTDAAMAQSITSQAGSFSGAGRKSGHGSVNLVRNADGTGTLTFANFKVSRGPALRVWLSNAASIAKSKDVKSAEYIDIGKLKDSKGDQSYTISKAEMDAGYDQIVIWCKPFGVLFASAKLG